jgi:transcriptional regulator GlxA family with amidase domain
MQSTSSVWHYGFVNTLCAVKELTPRKQQQILILVNEPSKTFEVAALLNTFGEANRFCRPGSGYELRVVAEKPNEDLHETADTLFVTGPDTRIATTWLRRQAARTRRLAAISNGTVLLAEAGLLHGKRATAHWQHQDEFAARFPRVLWQRDVLYAQDGNLYTCAGAASSIDLALCMIEEDLGPGVAAQVAQSLVIPFRRAGGAPQISAALRAQEAQAGPIARLLAWLPDNLQQDLSVTKLARRSAMSARNFSRTFRKELGLTPAKHIESLRLEAAQAKLESTSLTVDAVAFATGFECSETMRRLFVRRLGMTPGRYRSRAAKSRQAEAAATDCPESGSVATLIEMAS